MALEPINNNGIQYQDAQRTSMKQTDNRVVLGTAEETAKAQLSQNKNSSKEASDEMRIQSAVKHANKQMKHARTECEFSYHEKTKRVSIKVIDKDTKEVIREIPPEETLEMVEKMWELAGILVDERR